jgi:hypothetical protein
MYEFAFDIIAVFGSTLDRSAMEISANPVRVQEILLWRNVYRREMDCQVVYDSLHSREGWTQPPLPAFGLVSLMSVSTRNWCYLCGRG